MDKCTAELYRDQGNTDIAELVVDEMTQCEICTERNAKRNVCLPMWFNPYRVTGREEGKFERNEKHR